MLPFTTLPALPPIPDIPIVAFPADHDASSGQGVIVQFADEADRAWIGHFKKGARGVDRVDMHPNGRDVIVIAGGTMWIVDRQQRAALPVWEGVEYFWTARSPERFIARDRQSFRCLDAGGERWRTPALSERSVSDDVQLQGDRLVGRAWAVLTLTWIPFRINLDNGAIYDGQAQIETPFDLNLVAGQDQAPPLPLEGQRQLAVTRNLRRAGLACVLALPAVVLVIYALNRLTGGRVRLFASGEAWTEVFWSMLFALIGVGILLLFATMARRCPRCQNSFFSSKGYSSSASRQSRGSVNVFARRCMNCRLPLKAG